MNRMIERDWQFTEADTYGIQRVVDASNPWRGKVPITPMMDTQLDQIVIQDFLIRRRDKLIADLQAKLDAARRNDFFEVFLVMFILATNLEWLLRHCKKSAERYGAMVGSFPFSVLSFFFFFFSFGGVVKTGNM